MFCLHVGTCTTRVLGACGSQKTGSDTLELELLVVLSRHVGARKQTLGPLQEQEVF